MSTAFSDFGPLTERRRVEKQRQQRRRVMLAAGGASVVLILIVMGGAAVAYNASVQDDDSSSSSPSSPSGGSSGSSLLSVSKSVKMMCAQTDYKDACEKSLSKAAANANASASSPKDMVRAAVAVIGDAIGEAFSRSAAAIGDDPRVKAAVADCKEIYEDARADLARTLAGIDAGGLDEVTRRGYELRVWLSAVIAHMETCIDGFPDGELRRNMTSAMESGKELTSNALAIIEKASSFLAALHITGGTAAAAASHRRMLLSVREGEDVEKQPRVNYSSTFHGLRRHDDSGPAPAAAPASRRLFSVREGEDVEKQPKVNYSRAFHGVGGDDDSPAAAAAAPASRRLFNVREGEDVEKQPKINYSRAFHGVRGDQDSPAPAAAPASRRLFSVREGEDVEKQPKVNYSSTFHGVRGDEDSPAPASRRLFSVREGEDVEKQPKVNYSRAFHGVRVDDDSPAPAVAPASRRLFTVREGEDVEKQPKVNYSMAFHGVRGDDNSPAPAVVPARRRLFSVREGEDVEKQPKVNYSSTFHGVRGDQDSPAPAPAAPTRRRLLGVEDGDTPPWVNGEQRRLLKGNNFQSKLKPNVVVAKDGSGKFKTINDALKAMPPKYTGRYLIYVKAGVYEEYVTITRAMENVTMYGDGAMKTIITGSRNFADGLTTYKTATFNAQGDGFIGIALGFRNTAGAAKHQAVALLVQSDRSIFLNCRMDAYQDTLYAHSKAQFYRNCVISGTIDFVFGDAAAVFQNCVLVLRRPMDNQQNIATAQGRADGRESTGFVFQRCRFTAESALTDASRPAIRSYLARPWREFSRTLIMESEIPAFIDKAGYLPWNGEFGLKTLWYAEYANRGPGADTAGRVTWPGYKKVITKEEAAEFTVQNFLHAEPWLKPAGAPVKYGFWA
ncbi:unnamed protein product [Urochloa humidicola]